MSRDGEDELGGSRLSAWSRRKRAAARGDQLEPVEQQDDQSEPEPDPAAEAEREARLLANRQAAEAIDIESLDSESDYSIFLKEGVPLILRRQALRILWRSDPKFAVLDGLNNYDENYADPKFLLKNFQSAWQIGKGYAKKETAKAADEPVPAKPEPAPEQIAEAELEEVLEVTAEADPVLEPQQLEPEFCTPEPPAERQPAGRTSLRNRLLS